MKKIVLILVFAISATVVMHAQCCGKDNKKTASSCHDKKTTSDNSQILNEGAFSFKVEGKCDMCKDRIETAAIGVKGVQSVFWDTETHQLTVKSNEEVKPEDVYQAVANAGHDTEKFKASDKTYKALPKCCKYRI